MVRCLPFPLMSNTLLLPGSLLSLANMASLGSWNSIEKIKTNVVCKVSEND